MFNQMFLSIGICIFNVFIFMLKKKKEIEL